MLLSKDFLNYRILFFLNLIARAENESENELSIFLT